MHTPEMPDYRRNQVPDGTFFFAVNLLDRRSSLLVANINALRDAVRRVRARAPFHIDAWVVLLPHYMHCLWTLPQDDADFPGRCAISGMYPAHWRGGSDEPQQTGERQ